MANQKDTIMGYIRIVPRKGKTFEDMSPAWQALAEEQNKLADDYEREHYGNVEAHDAIKRNAEEA